MKNNYNLLKFDECYKRTILFSSYFLLFLSIPVNLILIYFFDHRLVSLILLIVMFFYYLFSNKINLFLCLIYYGNRFNDNCFFLLKNLKISCKQYILFNNVQNTFILKNPELFLHHKKKFIQLSHEQHKQLKNTNFISKVFNYNPFIKQFIPYQKFFLKDVNLSHLPYNFFEHVETNQLIFYYDDYLFKQYDYEFEKIFSEELLTILLSEIHKKDTNNSFTYNNSKEYYKKHDELTLKYLQKRRAEKLHTYLNSVVNQKNINARESPRTKV